MTTVCDIMDISIKQEETMKRRPNNETVREDISRRCPCCGSEMECAESGMFCDECGWSVPLAYCKNNEAHPDDCLCNTCITITTEE